MFVADDAPIISADVCFAHERMVAETLAESKIFLLLTSTPTTGTLMAAKEPWQRTGQVSSGEQERTAGRCNAAAATKGNPPVSQRDERQRRPPLAGKRVSTSQELE